MFLNDSLKILAELRKIDNVSSDATKIFNYFETNIAYHKEGLPLHTYHKVGLP